MQRSSRFHRPSTPQDSSPHRPTETNETLSG
jgi:hypothetical protein